MTFSITITAEHKLPTGTVIKFEEKVNQRDFVMRPKEVVEDIHRLLRHRVIAKAKEIGVHVT